MFWKALFLVASFSAFCYAEDVANEVASYKPTPHPDVGLRVPELVAKYGYPIENHEITTKDGYILTVHRIPHGKNNSDITTRPAVFLMHGLLCSSADWVLTGPEKGLGILLADLGYDVWMGNARGNTYSRKHVKYNPDIDRKKFWDFSWHEIGSIDVPAIIDHILETTNHESIYYIGHSQGTTAFFVMASTYPEYNDKVNLMIALGPAAYMKHMPNIVLRFIGLYYKTFNWISSMLGAYEFLPSTKFMQIVGQTLCNDESITQGLCSNILFLIAGFDNEQLNKTMIPVILSNTPAGSSTKQFVHYVQIHKSGKFRQYDYGFMKNLIKYGKLSPPDYDLRKVSAPVVLFYGKNDLLVSEIDVQRIRDEIQHTVLMYRMQHKKFSHLDFLWGTDVVTMLYNRIFDLLERF